jgi:hypothetical protein
MNHVKTLYAFGVSALLVTPGAWADPVFNYIRLGDLDGFGYTSTAGLVRATPMHTTAADTNGNGVLEAGEFLPDLNKNGTVATGSGDDFDNRSAAEKANTAAPTGTGFTNTGSSGSKWTDISLSTSFSGPDFPDPTTGVPNEPSLIFDFTVDASAVVVGTQLFFNLLFGDYDVLPANVTLSFDSAAGRTVSLTRQVGTSDGLIQAAFATLDFDEVFTANGAGGYDGYLKVDFIAPNEPYTAFDYTELSVTQIATGLPVPPTLPLVGAALLALGLARRGRACG